MSDNADQFSRRAAGDLPGTPWILGLGLVLAYFVLSTSVSYRSLGIIEEDNIAVSHSLQVVAELNELRLNIARAESGQRGYLLTTNEKHLEPYFETVSGIDRLLASLSAALESEGADQAGLHAIAATITELLAEMDTTIAMVGEDHYLNALNRVHAGTAVQLMERVNTLIAEKEAERLALLEARRVQAAHSRARILLGVMVANLLGILLACGLFVVLYSHARKMARLHEQLEDKVAERTQALQTYSDELQRSNRELEEFAFVASHDLQEPLRKIRAFGDRLQQKYGDVLGEQGADYLARMQGASGRMSQLIEDLLSFSRVTTRRNPFVPVALNDVLAQTLDDLEVRIEEFGAEVVSDNLPTIDADPFQIAQVFANLIGNSLKFRHRDRPPRLEIHVQVDAALAPVADESDRLWCRLVFRDNGIGFAQEYADRVFNLFQRLHGREEYEGTGIGLALCRKIVELHGGSISVQSEPERGSEFVVLLPVTQAEPAVTFDDEVIADES